MKISIVPFTSELEAAAARFNARMHDARAPTAFLLPERSHATTRHGEVTVTHYVACDEQGDVRGGMLCHEYPAHVAGRTARVLNISAPLSEGIIDPAYTWVGSLLIKHALRENPLAFVVGMGGPDKPLPRLLRAMRWTVSVVPFYFRMLNAGRCAQELAPFRASRGRRFAASIAATTGIAAIGALALHRASREAANAAREFTVDAITEWDTVAEPWNAFVPRTTFAVERTPGVLPFFYPLNRSGFQVWAMKRSTVPVGWFGLAITRMSANPYFGDLTVAVLTDCVGTTEAVQAGPMLAIERAKAAGAELLITNQQHQELQTGCVRAGWRAAPSNYLLATSPTLSTQLRSETTYLTRRDGDGLVNLIA